MREMAYHKQMKSVWYDIEWDDQEKQVLLEIYPPSKEEKKFGKHPTQKPEKLLERLILAASDEGNMVFDPFYGSGTTAVVAMKLGRKFVGCELDPQYISIAIKRLSTGISQQSLGL
jgi:site-specific DNA-methyltransferase (adenine-specific)